MMSGVSIVTDDSSKPSSNGSVTCFHHLKDISVEDSSLVLTEIKLNTRASPSPSYPLKRKRTLNIQIPVAPQQPQTPKLSCCDGKLEKQVFEYNASGCSVFCKKGRKKVMEDAHKIVSHLNVGVKKGFFGVYDGHGGHKAAEFVADNLHTNIFGMLEKCGGDMGKEEAVRTGYLKTDEEFLKQYVRYLDGEGASIQWLREHIELKYHFLSESAEKDKSLIFYIALEELIANPVTKSLPL